MIPTLEEVMNVYPMIADAERMKTGRPSAVSVNNVLHGVHRLCEAAQVKLTDSIAVFTRHRIDMALGALMKCGLQRVSAKTYRDDLHALFARWCLPYYDNCGWEIPAMAFPLVRGMPMRYLRPSAELLTKVKSWYCSLDGEWWWAATLLLEFAVRNGDILRMTDSNIVVRKEIGSNGVMHEGHFLSYTPHKTAQSSGRHVCWQMDETIWQRFYDHGGIAGLDVTEETFKDINRELRALGFTGTKAAYELRKICIDHIYQKYGVEAAVSISGDDIRTISRYYADPSRPTAGEMMRVIDML